MGVQVQLRRFNTMERRPRMLKDFLSENSNSCSSSGFKSLPRKPNDTPSSMHSLIEKELKSRRKNSSNNYSPFQTLINTIRNISFFTAVKKSPSMLLLPRSLSRKLSSSSRSRRRNETFCKGGSSEIKITTVKIKDIIRWKSFRDLVEEHHHQHHQFPLSPPPPPLQALDFHHCTVGSTTTTATTTTTTTTTCSSSGSSWCDSDFTSGYLSSWEAQNDNVEEGKKFSFSPFVVGKDSVEQATGTAVGTKEVLTCQEDEQQSPVSVLQVGEDEFSPFDQSLDNTERRKQKFMQTVQRFESLKKFDRANIDQSLSLDEKSSYDEEYDDDDYKEVEEQDWVEEKARHMLLCVKATGSVQSCKDYYLDTLLLDFFRKELTRRRNQQTRNDDKFEWEILRIAEDWINGSFAYDTELVNKDTYIKDMDRRGRWSRFEQEKEELALEIETAILQGLVADLLDLDG